MRVSFFSTVYRLFILRKIGNSRNYMYKRLHELPGHQECPIKNNIPIYNSQEYSIIQT